MIIFNLFSFLISYLSASLSLSIFFLAWSSKIVPELTKAFVISSTSSVVSILFSSLLFYTTSTLYPNAVEASTAPAYQLIVAEEEKKTIKSPPRVTTTSSEKAINLSERIKNLNGKMYGAYWCSHCNNQKKEFGSAAVKNIEYIECDKEGFNSQYDLCKLKKVLIV
jgi:hypothetical protein